MRIAIVSWSSRRVGGVEEYVSLVIRALRGAGAEVAFWHEVDDPTERERVHNDPAVVDFCASSMGVSLAVERLRDWKPDVLYVQGLQDADVEAQLLNIAPAVFFLHTYTGTCISGTKTLTRPEVGQCERTFGSSCLVQYFPRGCGGRNPITMAHLFRAQSHRLRLLRRYRSILTHTDHMRREMERHGLEAEVIPYAVDAGAAPAEMKHPGVRLLFAGRMETVKGGNVLIDAAPYVFGHLKAAVQVVLAGDGRDRAAWEARALSIARTHVGVSYEFRGWLSQCDVGGLMQSVDLLVVPSLWAEPFGAVGPAAAQHGVPAAAFDVGGIPQWLHEGVSGHLAPSNPPTVSGLADAIVRCLANPTHYQALCEGARRVSQTFTMEHHLPELLRALAA